MNRIAAAAVAPGRKRERERGKTSVQRGRRRRSVEEILSTSPTGLKSSLTETGGNGRVSNDARKKASENPSLHLILKHYKTIFPLKNFICVLPLVVKFFHFLDGQCQPTVHGS